MVWRVLIAVLALSCAARAQSFSFGAQAGILVRFAQPSSLALCLQAEARDLIGRLGLRASLGFSGQFEAALDGVYRFDGLDQGYLYLGTGFGYANDLEWRGLIGYEWQITQAWRIGLEAVTRFPLGGEPRLSVLLGVIWFVPRS